MNKESIKIVRDIILMAAEAPNNTIKPKDIMNKFNCSLDNAFNYLDPIEFLGLVKSELLRNNNENNGYAKLTPHGIQIAELMKNQDRWEKAMNICEDIDIYSLDMVIEILKRCISKEIQNAIDKKYPIV